jgi:hypothetical protein
MLYKRKQLPEIYYLLHRNDTTGDHIDYENKILNKSLSPYMYQNNIMNGFLIRLQPLVALLFDQMNILKNFRNYLVDKDWYK